MKTNMKHLFAFAVLLLALGASAQDLTVKFMLDSSGAMKEQDIVLSASSILAAEISDFTRNSSSLTKDSSIRILVDSFWQKDNTFQTQGIFDYRLGQSSIPNYDGLRDLKTKWFVNDETALNKLINRNWPAENKNTVLVILTNSQENLEAGEIQEINNDAKKMNSKLIIAVLPRKNNYNESALKAEIAKRIHGALEEVKSYITALQFKMAVKVSVNGKQVDPNRKVTAAAPVKIDMKALVSGGSKFSWRYKGAEKTEKDITIVVENAADFIVTAVGLDNMGNEHLQEVKFNILPVPKAVANFSFFPVSGVAPLTISTSNKSANARKYQWNWGDGTPESNEKEPSHTYKAPGEYTITLNILGENGDVVSGKTKINVSYPPPVAKFNVPTGVSTDNFAEFSNISQNATRWSWNFGDGTEGSSEKSPKHKFAKPGSYKVVLQAFNPNGLSAKYEDTIKVGEKLEAGFEWETSSTDSRSVTFKNISKGAVKYNWDFGDGETSTETAPTHLFAIKATKGFNVSLTAIAENGQQLTKTERITISVKQVAVKPLIANFTCIQQTEAAEPTIKFTNKSIGGVKYSWDFGDGSQSTDSSPTHVYNISDVKNVNVSLSAFAADGRESKKVLAVKITPPSSGSSLGTILVIILVIAAIGIVVAIKFLKKGKNFTVTLFSKDNKTLGKKSVKVGEIVPITSLNGGSDLDFQIVKAEDDSGDDFKVRFRKPEESPSVVKQKSSNIHLNTQWCDAVDMSNLTVDSGRLVFSDGNNEEGEE